MNLGARRQFGVVQADGTFIGPAKYLSAWASIGPACDLVATILAGPLLEKYGQMARSHKYVVSFISIAGILFQQLATEWRTHGVNGIAIGVMFTISSLWIG
ncbi:hypothetical protein V1524DRAFT_441987 [Lipomyces starkeyi]